MRILVTNDDGVDSVGLHRLAEAMTGLGDVVVAAPDREYSGSSSSLGSLFTITPEIHKITMNGVPEAWAVTGPPGLCVMFARLGAFGDPFDLVVSGINPGTNVGRAIYHSGTIGAAITARNGGIHGVAVSQAVAEWAVDGQAWDDVLDRQLWDTAAEVAYAAVAGLIAYPPPSPAVLNINVPNLPLGEIKGWRRSKVGLIPPRTMTDAVLEPRPGHEDAFRVTMTWGDPVDLPIETDGGAVMNGYVAVSWLSRIVGDEPEGIASTESGLDNLLSR